MSSHNERRLALGNQSSRGGRATQLHSEVSLSAPVLLPWTARAELACYIILNWMNVFPAVL